MSASEIGQKADNDHHMGLPPLRNTSKSPPFENSCVNSRHSVGCADGMDVSTYTAVYGVGP